MQRAHKLPLLIIQLSGCGEADTALSIAEFSRTKALRCGHTLSVKHTHTHTHTKIGDESVLVVRPVISGGVFVERNEKLTEVPAEGLF